MDANQLFTDPLKAGYAALDRGAWEEARTSFLLALSREETPKALEGLGRATLQLKDAALALVVRERAYWLYQERRDRPAAARVAASLALDYHSLMLDDQAFRANRALVSRWLERAKWLVSEVDQGPQPGWITLSEGTLALLLRDDTERAQQCGAEAAALGRTLGLRELERDGLALEREAQRKQADLAAAARPRSGRRRRTPPLPAFAPLLLWARFWVGRRRGLVAGMVLLTAVLLVTVGLLLSRQFTQRPGTAASVLVPTTAVEPAPSPVRRRQSTGASGAPSAQDTTSSPIAPLASPGAAVPSPQAPLRTVLDEDFTDNQRQWPHNPQATAWFADGSYHLFAREPGRFVAIGAPLPEPVKDVVVTGTFRKIGGPPGGGYGLIVRDQGPGPRDGINQVGRYYVLEAGDRGEVGLWQRDGDRWVDLLPWSPSQAVRPGGARNQLTVQAIGARFTFLVNGIQVADVSVDSALGEGAVGVFVGGDFNEVVIDRFLVQVPG